MKSVKNIDNVFFEGPDKNKAHRPENILFWMEIYTNIFECFLWMNKKTNRKIEKVCRAKTGKSYQQIRLYNQAKLDNDLVVMSVK